MVWADQTTGKKGAGLKLDLEASVGVQWIQLRLCRDHIRALGGVLTALLSITLPNRSARALPFLWENRIPLRAPAVAIGSEPADGTIFCFSVF